MPKAKQTSAIVDPIPPALDPEGRQNQLIALAMDEVELRIRNHTATSQELTHFLKLGSIQAQTELEVLKLQKELIVAKTEQIKAQKNSEELFEAAMKAMASYSPDPDSY